MIPNVEFLRFVTMLGGGSATSSFTLYCKAYESAIRKYWPRAGTRVELSDQTKTVGRVEKGTAEIGIAATLVADLYFGNKPPTFTTPHTNISVMAITPSGNACIVVTLGDSPIKDISELRDKRIFVGQPGSSTFINTNLMLKAGYGFSYDDIKAAGGLVYTGEYGDAIELLMEGDLDACFIITAHPLADITRLDRSPRGMKCIEWNETALTLYASQPLGCPMLIPAGTYKALTTDYKSAGAMFVTLTPKGLPDDAIYNLLVASFENEGAAFKAVHPQMAILEWVNSGSVQKDYAVPFHSGAKKFWWEIWEKRGLL